MTKGLLFFFTFGRVGLLGINNWVFVLAELGGSGAGGTAPIQPSSWMFNSGSFHGCKSDPSKTERKE
ncbi:uncharacterized protein THITE_2124679 [Thermothielavioides terrestris NRRL 8126]|jgi:hypothetical protein|uniref:Uncharacterized protein n=1 Tax=Thermothielavioides terrestris (strain ATCC 38088 / NRRL 8126) TaxID=578455 RepID=G2RG92_THETT|nr:uncharacterized protein THITE_2124679 [Thermothielavioides terrestris NRRL 8126]AEO71835.1 hypothetical protein THITE_2124679 [Thermothielavioides terrestris NRRL 8126]